MKFNRAYMDDEWTQGRQVWAPVIGRLLLAFGEIEYCLMICLGPLDDRQNWGKLLTPEFKEKASKSIRVLEDKHKHAAPAASTKAIRLLNESIKLAEYRNLVAHNPLNIGAYTENSEDDIRFRLVIGSLRNPEKLITLAELQEVTEAAESVAAELHDIIHYLWWHYE